MNKKMQFGGSVPQSKVMKQVSKKFTTSKPKGEFDDTPLNRSIAKSKTFQSKLIRGLPKDTTSVKRSGGSVRGR